MNIYIKTMAFVIFGSAMVACDGDTKTVEKEIVIPEDQNLNLVGKSYGDPASIKFEFISATRVKVIEQFDDESTALLAGEYSYTVEKNEVTIDLNSTFPNQRATQVATIFNNEIINNPSGQLAKSYNAFLVSLNGSSGLSADDYKTFFDLVIPFFEKNGIQVAMGRPIGNSVSDELDVAEELSLIIGAEGQFVRLKFHNLELGSGRLLLNEVTEGIGNIQSLLSTF